MRYTLSPAAQADVDDIWRKTAEGWGADQAERYILAIKAAVERLAARPLSGPACDQVRKGYRRQRTGSHILFYRLSRDGIEVVRILHERMDAGRHL